MVRIVVLFAFLCFSVLESHAADPLNSDQKKEVRDLVRETLLENPEIIMEAMKVLQARQELASAKQQKSALTQFRASLINGPLTPISGNPDGDVTLIEFFDYQCGYCKKAFPGVMRVINDDKNIRYVSKEFAILGPVSEIAARAALAAEKQGRYMDFHVAMMTVRGRLNENKILKTAQSLGLNMDQLKTDMQSDQVSAEIQTTRAIASSLGITGTPAFIIGDQIIPGAVPEETLKEAISQYRNK